MRRDTQKRGEPRGTYRVKNWAAYNAGLIARGDVTMWIDQSVLASSSVGVSRRGRLCVYPDAVIQMLLVTCTPRLVRCRCRVRSEEERS
jgi:hypothetical protein